MHSEPNYAISHPRIIPEALSFVLRHLCPVHEVNAAFFPSVENGALARISLASNK